jgi:hypothetical protein
MTMMANWFLGIFTTLATFFAKYVGRRFAIALTGTTALLAMTGAMYAALVGLISGMVAQISNPYVLIGMSAVMPDNFELCISVYFAARIIMWAYNFNKDLLHMYLGGI